MIIYLDTNIWLDYFLQRESKYISNKDVALNIFQRAVSCEFQIIMTDILLEEITKYVDLKKTKNITNWISHKLIFVTTTTQDEDKARKIPIHFPDNLHFILAKKEKATLVSNDKEMQKLGAISSQVL